MKKTRALVVVIALVAVYSSATDVTIDYAHTFDFESVKTFEYMQTTDSNAADSLIDGRIRAAIIRAMNEGGLTRVESDPDLYVTYHLTTKDNTVYDTSYFGYGTFGSGWGGWGAGMGSAAATRVSTYTKGTLVVDAFAADDKKVVWRGTGIVTIDSDHDQQSKEIEKILKELGKKWQKILAGKGK